MQRRERRRDDQHVLLDQGLPGLPAAGRPDAFLPGFFADLEAGGGVLVGPDVAPDVEVAEFGMAGKRQRRQLYSLVDRGRPTVDLVWDRARPHRIEADLVDAAELARLELWRERRRDEDLAGLVNDEF